MNSNHRSKSILVVAVYICVMAIAITATLSPLWAQTSSPSSLSRSVAPSLSRADIQSALDDCGYCWIPAGVHHLDGPIVIRANMTLDGAGKMARLYLRGDAGGVAIQFGQPATDKPNAIYGAYVRNISIVGGSFVAHQIANHCDIDRVWVSDSPGDGFLIRAVGERLALAHCVAWGNRGYGFRLETLTTAPMNGIVLDHCTATGNIAGGVLLASGDFYSQLTETVLRDCTIQGNGVPLPGDLNGDGSVDLGDIVEAQKSPGLTRLPEVLARYGSVAPLNADVRITGSVHNTWFEHGWIEPTKTGVGVLVESALQPRGQSFDVARPDVMFWGANVISVARRTAIVARNPWSLVIDALRIGSGKRSIDYTGPVPQVTPPRIGNAPELVGTLPAASGGAGLQPATQPVRRP